MTIRINGIDKDILNLLVNEVDLNTKHDIVKFLLFLNENYNLAEFKIIVNYLIENNIINYKLHDLIFLDFDYNYFKLVESLNIPNIPKRKWYQRLF